MLTVLVVTLKKLSISVNQKKMEIAIFLPFALPYLPPPPVVYMYIEVAIGIIPLRLKTAFRRETGSHYAGMIPILFQACMFMYFYSLVCRMY